ncbi:glycosyltransferase family 4 protein [Pararhizobium sp.]|uniref:glycosyltransferase family 4 protein n=1 Tax=Pararhizobium sp. TaxID=1977563 RepID=UPI002724C2E9|nr:glycosyltransferase family 1 protein [Pararhizobium sp.]MDO9417289.1 glycosyltransferase family 1 protein [Pararhizobium sp.]
MKVVANARVTGLKIGGQQRAAIEILDRLPEIERIAPSQPLSGIKAHLWEQTVLPARTFGKLLWSPSATGPVIKTQQVVTLHDVAFLDLPEFFSSSFVKLYKNLLPPLVRRATRVVTVSEFSRLRIAETLGIATERIDVIGNGVSSHFRAYAEADIAAVRAALSLPCTYVLLQATADKRKNLTRTLQAWAVAQKQLPDDIQLVVSGNPDRSHVFGTPDAVPEVPRTKFIGYVEEDQIGPLMAGATAFLFPSLYEGFGIPIIEAMSCRTPVLTAALTATREIAEDAALLVDPYSVDDIAAGIVRLVEDADLRAELMEKGWRVAAKHTWDDVAGKYRTLFSSIGADF